MRKFSGRPLKRIKKEAKAIFNEAQALLKRFKQPGVLDSRIDTLCGEVILILTASYDFFGTLLQKNSSDDNVNDAEAKRNKLVRLIRNLGILNGNLTVKGHIIEDHAIGWMQTCRAWGLPLRLIIEQSVELNHQTGKRLDKQGKRFAVAKTMANTMCKRKALETNNLVRKRIKYVHKKTTKGGYKKTNGALDATLLAALADINPHQQ